MVQNIVILGAQWGDEGKGKIVDSLASQVQYVVRYQGGHNAGHTIIVNDRKIVLHLIPSGILHNHVINIIAGGVVLSPVALLQEIQYLEKMNVSIHKRVFISAFCALILPYHVAIDVAREKRGKGSDDLSVIGTTGCGIGPAYEDKVARRALRISDLYDRKCFETKLKQLSDYYNFQLVHYYNEEPINYKIVLDEILSISDSLIDMVIDVSELLINARKKGEKVIFEGAQGSLLDIDHGTYPYVTSASTVAGGATINTGIGPSYIDYSLGIMKAYATRVGLGPFPTELLNNDDDCGRLLYKLGNEFGSTTGRRRRIGWFDSVSIRHAIRISSIGSCGLTKIDVLDGLKEIKICVAYQTIQGKIIYDFPGILEQLNNIIPIYEILPGWFSPTRGITIFNKLPKEAQFYIRRLEEVLGIPIDVISTGPDRFMNIVLRNPIMD